MQQTKKTYKKIGDNYAEDINGYLIGYEWTINNILRRNIYTASSDDLEREISILKSVLQWYDPSNNTWKNDNTNLHRAMQDTWVDSNGIIDNSPYENDLTNPIMGVTGTTIVYVDDMSNPIYDGENIIGYNQTTTEVNQEGIIGYNQKIKDGLTTEFSFFYNIRLSLFEATIQSTQSNKYGATSFN